MTLTRPHEDWKNVGRTAAIDAGRPGRGPYVRFRVTAQPGHWMPPHSAVFRVELSLNRLFTAEFVMVGKRYR